MDSMVKALEANSRASFFDFFWRYSVKTGTKETVSKIKRDDIIKFYQQNYVKKNIVITVVGNFEKDAANKIENKFNDVKNKELEPIVEILEPKQEKKEEYIEKRKIDHSYFVIGYKVPGRNDQDSYVLDLIRIIMGTGQNSRLYEEMRLKRGLGYSVGSHYEGNKNYGFFASFITAEKKNMKECKSIIIDEYKKIADVNDREINDSKRFITSLASSSEVFILIPTPSLSLINVVVWDSIFIISSSITDTFLHVSNIRMFSALIHSSPELTYLYSFHKVHNRP